MEQKINMKDEEILRKDKIIEEQKLENQKMKEELDKLTKD